MARLIRPTWAIRCTQSSCRTLFEVAKLEDGKQQEVVCPNCGEEYDLLSGAATPQKGHIHEPLRQLNILNADGKLTVTQK